MDSVDRSHCIMQLGVWGTVIPPVGAGWSLGGGSGGEAPRSSGNLAFYTT